MTALIGLAHLLHDTQPNEAHDGNQYQYEVIHDTLLLSVWKHYYTGEGLIQ